MAKTKPNFSNKIIRNIITVDMGKTKNLGNKNVFN